MKSSRPSPGFSLIELMVVIALIGIVIALGIPAFGTWSADSRVRATAEALTNSLRVAQATAVARNRVAMLVMTTAAPAYGAAATAPSGTTSNWFVGAIPLAGSDETAASLAASGAGLINGSTLSSQYGVLLTSTPTTAAVVCFNSIGQQTTQTAAQTGVSLGCTAPTALPTAFAVNSAKATRKFQVLVYPGGQIRMCDALKTLSATVPDGCP